MKKTQRHRKLIRRIRYSVIFRPGRERISRRARMESALAELWEEWEQYQLSNNQ